MCVVAIHSQLTLPHRCDSPVVVVVYTPPYPPDRRFITRGKWNEKVGDLEAGEGLVLNVEVSRPCRPVRCLHAMSTAMCVWYRRVAVRTPHVCGYNPCRCLHPFIADMCVHT